METPDSSSSPRYPGKSPDIPGTNEIHELVLLAIIEAEGPQTMFKNGLHGIPSPVVIKSRDDLKALKPKERESVLGQIRRLYPDL